MDIGKIERFGWKPAIKLEEGIRKTIVEIQDQF
jgi:nucleoside-diphosphate-sugar epimerase